MTPKIFVAHSTSREKDTMNFSASIHSNPMIGGTIGTTTTNPDPALETKIKNDAVTLFKAKVPGLTNIRVMLSTLSTEWHPTSERAIYNHYGYVGVEATGINSEGKNVNFDAKYYVHSSELQFVNVK